MKSEKELKATRKLKLKLQCSMFRSKTQEKEVGNHSSEEVTKSAFTPVMSLITLEFLRCQNSSIVITHLTEPDFRTVTYIHFYQL